MLGSSRGHLLEEFFLVFGNVAVQIIFGVYMVFLNGVFAAGVDPLFLIVFGNLVTAVFVLPFSVVFEKKKWPTTLSPALLSRFFLIALGGATLFQVLTLTGIKKASPAIASAMPNLTPGLIFIIAACFRFERFERCCRYSRTKILGTLVCLSGAIAMCFLQTPSEESSSSLGTNLSALLAKPLTVEDAILNDWLLGCLCLLAGVVVLSCTTVLQAATMREFPAPLSLVVITSVMGSCLTALFQFITEGKISAGSSSLSFACIAGINILGGVLVGVCVAFQTWCIIKKGPVLVAIFSPIQTVSTVVLSAILLGELISLGSLAGIVLMFAGLYLVLWAKNKEDFGLHDDAEAAKQQPVEDIEKPLLS
ncbi:WAT1-related protein [Canna indica]|uniref:WAT1-related protein n=1 Tax=Canna indica TaxID=4628 RepID=A0AAQ3L784_9LILI|nr:WAT1-related protein [Canna indica]